MTVPTARRGRMALATLLAVAMLAVTDRPASAEASDGGASSRVVGRGDIVTSIIGWGSGRRSGGGSGPAPACRWVTLHDAQIEWLAAVSAASAGIGGPNPVLDSVRGHLGGDELPDGDLQARVCGTETTGVRFVERVEPLDAVELLQRRMITRLPVPDPRFSPPVGDPVPLHQPVFTSIDPDGWQPIDATISADGVTAEVRAEPVGLRVISGDPTGELVACTGPARPYAMGGAPVQHQAADPRSCTVRYRTPSPVSDGPAGSTPWIGTVTVMWRAQWRTVGGPWQPLGTIPRTRLFARVATELHTSIESGGR